MLALQHFAMYIPDRSLNPLGNVLNPTMNRLHIALAVLAALLALLTWQTMRERMVADCTATGGQWDGYASRCRLVPPRRIYIRRELDRTDNAIQNRRSGKALGRSAPAHHKSVPQPDAH